ncbi:MAG TPA: pitrilysin family protein [Vicinamibacterales bacterium]
MKRIVLGGLLAFVVAGQAARLGGQSGPDRSRPPEPGPAPELRLPEVRTARLSNGVPVHVVEMHEVPVVEIAVVIDAGAEHDPAGKFGLASLTAAMLDEGAAGRSALTIADEIALLGATLRTGASYDAASVRLGVPVARLDRALPILADVVLRPDFPAEELERVRKERLTALLQARDDPGWVASRAFARLLYGKTHRYGTDERGTSTSLTVITDADLRDFHRTYYQPSRAALIVAGDVRHGEVIAQLEQAFGTWRASSSASPRSEAPMPPQPDARRIVLIDRPGAAQSQVRIGWVGVPRTTPDYFPLIVLNTVLGGSFTSRLNTNLRETHGYAYGAFSQFQMRRGPGPFVAAAGVQSDRTAEALREFFRELTAIREPIPDDEFGRAQRNIALGFGADFETTGDMVDQLQQLVVYRLPEDEYSRYIPRVLAVTPSDARRAALERLDPERFLVVVVGDLASIEAPVRALGLGPVTVADAGPLLE